jgi:hypothetical protein
MRDLKKVDDTGQKGEDKVSSLLSYRKAKGLCYKCGEKWGRGHTCPAQVPLPVVEELMSAVHIETGQQLTAEDSDSEEGLELMEVHEAKEQNDHKVKRPTMRLLGWIGNQQALILVDSGSAATFISTPMVDKCKLPVQKAA